jgi:antitoxin (DNA-binding transcriptional repressor) of toxin-antitoxin stability system
MKTAGDCFFLDLVYYLVYKLTMIRLNVHEAKTHLSRYLDKVAEGESILLCRRNIPVAEIRPLPNRQRAQRPIGLAKGLFKIPKSFFEPLPQDVVKSFYGKPK